MNFSMDAGLGPSKAPDLRRSIEHDDVVQTDGQRQRVLPDLEKLPDALTETVKLPNAAE